MLKNTKLQESMSQTNKGNVDTYRLNFLDDKDKIYA